MPAQRVSAPGLSPMVASRYHSMLKCSSRFPVSSITPRSSHCMASTMQIMARHGHGHGHRHRLHASSASRSLSTSAACQQSDADVAACARPSRHTSHRCTGWRLFLVSRCTGVRRSRLSSVMCHAARKLPPKRPVKDQGDNTGEEQDPEILRRAALQDKYGMFADFEGPASRLPVADPRPSPPSRPAPSDDARREAFAASGLGSVAMFRGAREEQQRRGMQELRQLQQEGGDLGSLAEELAEEGWDLEADWSELEVGRSTTGSSRSAPGGRPVPDDVLLAPPSNPKVNYLRMQEQARRRRRLFSDDDEDGPGSGNDSAWGTSSTDRGTRGLSRSSSSAGTSTSTRMPYGNKGVKKDDPQDNLTRILKTVLKNSEAAASPVPLQKPSRGPAPPAAASSSSATAAPAAATSSSSSSSRGTSKAAARQGELEDVMSWMGTSDADDMDAEIAALEALMSKEQQRNQTQMAPKPKPTTTTGSAKVAPASLQRPASSASTSTSTSKNAAASSAKDELEDIIGLLEDYDSMVVSEMEADPFDNLRISSPAQPALSQKPSKPSIFGGSSSSSSSTGPRSKAGSGSSSSKGTSRAAAADLEDIMGVLEEASSSSRQQQEGDVFDFIPAPRRNSAPQLQLKPSQLQAGAAGKKQAVAGGSSSSSKATGATAGLGVSDLLDVMSDLDLPAPRASLPSTGGATAGGKGKGDEVEDWEGVRLASPTPRPQLSVPPSRPATGATPKAAGNNQSGGRGPSTNATSSPAKPRMSDLDLPAPRASLPSTGSAVAGGKGKGDEVEDWEGVRLASPTPRPQLSAPPSRPATGATLKAAGNNQSGGRGPSKNATSSPAKPRQQPQQAKQQVLSRPQGTSPSMNSNNSKVTSTKTTPSTSNGSSKTGGSSNGTNKTDGGSSSSSAFDFTDDDWDQLAGISKPAEQPALQSKPPRPSGSTRTSSQPTPPSRPRVMAMTVFPDVDEGLEPASSTHAGYPSPSLPPSPPPPSAPPSGPSHRLQRETQSGRWVMAAGTGPSSHQRSPSRSRDNLKNRNHDMLGAPRFSKEARYSKFGQDGEFDAQRATTSGSNEKWEGGRRSAAPRTSRYDSVQRQQYPPPSSPRRPRHGDAEGKHQQQWDREQGRSHTESNWVQQVPGAAGSGHQPSRQRASGQCYGGPDEHQSRSEHQDATGRFAPAPLSHKHPRTSDFGERQWSGHSSRQGNSSSPFQGRSPQAFHSGDPRRRDFARGNRGDAREDSYRLAEAGRPPFPSSSAAVTTLPASTRHLAKPSSRSPSSTAPPPHQPGRTPQQPHNGAPPRGSWGQSDRLPVSMISLPARLSSTSTQMVGFPTAPNRDEHARTRDSVEWKHADSDSAVAEEAEEEVAVNGATGRGSTGTAAGGAEDYLDRSLWAKYSLNDDEEEQEEKDPAVVEAALRLMKDQGLPLQALLLGCTTHAATNMCWYHLEMMQLRALGISRPVQVPSYALSPATLKLAARLEPGVLTHDHPLTVCLVRDKNHHLHFQELRLPTAIYPRPDGMTPHQTHTTMRRVLQDNIGTQLLATVHAVLPSGLMLELLVDVHSANTQSETSSGATTATDTSYYGGSSSSSSSERQIAQTGVTTASTAASRAEVISGAGCEAGGTKGEPLLVSTGDGYQTVMGFLGLQDMSEDMAEQFNMRGRVKVGDQVECYLKSWQEVPGDLDRLFVAQLYM